MRGAHRCPPLAWRGWAATQCLRPMRHMGLLLPGTAGGFLMSSVSWQPFSTPSPSPPLPPPPPPPASSLSLFLPPLTFTSYWVCPLWNGARVREGALSPLRAGGDCEPQMAPGGGLWVAELSPLYMGAPGGGAGGLSWWVVGGPPQSAGRGRGFQGAGTRCKEPWLSFRRPEP